MRNVADPDDAWTFPTAEVLQAMYDEARKAITHIQLYDVALWHRVDGNGIATVMLSTINLSDTKSDSTEASLDTSSRRITSVSS